MEKSKSPQQIVIRRNPLGIIIEDAETGFLVDATRGGAFSDIAMDQRKAFMIESGKWDVVSDTGIADPH
jgi:hypothetical protein